MQGFTNVKTVNAGTCEEKSTKAGEEEPRMDTNEHESIFLVLREAVASDGMLAREIGGRSWPLQVLANGKLTFCGEACRLLISGPGKVEATTE